jgi:hypothetical protein
MIVGIKTQNQMIPLVGRSIHAIPASSREYRRLVRLVDINRSGDYLDLLFYRLSGLENPLHLSPRPIGRLHI